MVVKKAVRAHGNEVRIIATGRCLPDILLTNEDVLRYANLPEKCTIDWIENRVKIKTRHVARILERECKGPREGNRNSDLCKKAVESALQSGKLDKNELDLLIVSTATPDYPVPSTSTIVQDKLGIKEMAAIDIRSACCGSIQAFITAQQYLATGWYRTVAVVACDVGSVFGCVDQSADGFTRQDQVNAVMIGDGAACYILRGFDVEKGEQPFGMEILYSGMNSIGLGKEFGMYLPLGGSVIPPTHEALNQGHHYFKHDYRAVLKHGAELFMRAMNDCFTATGATVSDIDLFIPHQANGQLRELSHTIGVPQERVYHNFDRVGNTANASTLICVDELQDSGTLPENSLVLIGQAESTKWLYGSLLLRWKNLKKEGVVGPVASSKMWFYQRWINNTLFATVRTLVRIKTLLGI